MPHIESIAQEASNIIKKYDADYIEAHFEETSSSHISYRGKKLDSIDIIKLTVDVIVAAYKKK